MFFSRQRAARCFFEKKSQQSSVEQLATRLFRAGGLLVFLLAEEKSFEHVYYNF
jgi:hypothetical protein